MAGFSLEDCLKFMIPTLSNVVDQLTMKEQASEAGSWFA